MIECLRSNSSAPTASASKGWVTSLAWVPRVDRGHSYVVCAVAFAGPYSSILWQWNCSMHDGESRENAPSRNACSVSGVDGIFCA